MLLKVFLLVLACSTFALLQAQPKQFDTIVDALNDSEEFIKKIIKKANLPSVVFGISVKGKTIWSKAWGFKDLENEVIASLNTKYRLCSITKTFTSALISKLVEEGQITYSTNLSDILKTRDFPYKEWDNHPVNITIGQLLSHTSGLRETDVLHDFNDIHVVHNSIEMMHKFKDAPLVSKPGQKFLYSNYGFQVLGAVIEVLTKQTYQNAVRKFLKQMNMTSSFVETIRLMITDRARYYRPDGKHNVPTNVLDGLLKVEGYWSSGGLLSTVGDMLHYGQLMVDAYKGRPGGIFLIRLILTLTFVFEAILKPESVKEMWTPHTEVIPSHSDIPMTSHYGCLTLNFYFILILAILFL